MAMTGGTAYLVKSEKTNYGSNSWTTDLYIYVKVISQRVESEREKLAETVGGLIAEFGDRAQIDAIPNLSAIEGITEYAEKNEVDLIIMGRRGLGAFRGALGSVSYGILRATDVPVLTIK